jgi:ubiquinone/menaquinone biosynthesis C-methylase UbiE
MDPDQLSAFKARQREMWASFAPTQVFTTPVAANLVRFAGVKPGEEVLDIGTGTGVVAITAARAGAHVTAIDLTPVLVEHARENSKVAGVDVAWHEGDAEDLPFPDASFDVVISQFGHMFAPRPDVAMAEIRRVLKPSGRVAFTTWPPDRLVGGTFALVGRHMPPPPPGASPPPQWGDQAIITERLAQGFSEPVFERGVMPISALSLGHYRTFMERNIGPMQKLVESLADKPDELAEFRREFEKLAEPYFNDNIVKQEYLMTRADVR